MWCTPRAHPGKLREAQEALEFVDGDEPLAHGAFTVSTEGTRRRSMVETLEAVSERSHGDEQLPIAP